MIEQLKSIREALEAARLTLNATAVQGWNKPAIQCSEALAVLAQIEAAVGEPVADINVRPTESGGVRASVFWHKLPVGSWLVYAAPVAQQYEAGDMASAAAQGFRDGVASVTVEQEPVAWMVYTLDGKSVCVTDNPNDFTDQHKALPLYTAAPVAQQPQAEALTDEQRLGWYAWRVKDLEEKLANAQKQPQAEAVPLPTNAAEAELMQKVGLAWLHQHAPERLAPQQAEAVPQKLKETPPHIMEARGSVWIEPSEKTGWGGGWSLPTPQQAEAVPPSNLIDPGTVVSFAVDRWLAEVANRPLVNKNRRTLDDTWRQVIRRFGGDPNELLGPSHDELAAIAQQKGGV